MKNLKSNYNLKYLIFLLGLFFIIACQSHEQKTEDAFDQFKKGKSNKIDSNQIYREIIRELKAEEIQIRKEATDDWTKYKLETEKKIRINENKIKALKSKSISSTKSSRKIISLEKQNNSLKEEITGYNEEMKERLSKFKSSTDRHIIEIETELDDLKANSK